MTCKFCITKKTIPALNTNCFFQLQYPLIDSSQNRIKELLLMNLIHKRLFIFPVYKKLINAGYKIPKEDPSEENIECWKNAYNEELYKFEQLGQLTLPILTVWTTSHCTLQCKYCANYSPLMCKQTVEYRYQFKGF